MVFFLCGAMGGGWGVSDASQFSEGPSKLLAFIRRAVSNFPTYSERGNNSLEQLLYYVE